ncbi:MAG: hypothetical protein NTV50_12210 [Planctomycetota bacterium]|nr:hypothetical protein [Planctomycetota bacterium]
MALDKLSPIVIYTHHKTLKIESMVSVNSSWKNVVANIENTLNDCLLNIGNAGVDVDCLVNEESGVTKNLAFQQSIQNNLGKIEIALNKTNAQFNILSTEMETAAEALRDWIGKAKQCQDKVKSMQSLTSEI